MTAESPEFAEFAESAEFADSANSANSAKNVDSCIDSRIQSESKTDVKSMTPAAQ